MKTITKTIALVVATVAFAACTNQTIEPVRSITQLQTITIHPDTVSQITAVIDKQPRKYTQNNEITDEGLNHDMLRPGMTTEPIPQTMPIMPPCQKPHLNVMPIEQSDVEAN